MKTKRSWFVLVCAFLLIAIPASTCSWDFPIWIPQSSSADPLFRFTKGDKAGYIDPSGKIVIEPTLPHWGGNFGGEFHDGLMNLSGYEADYVGKDGKKANIKRFVRAWDFSDGLAAAMETSDGKWGFINTKGEFVISPRFASSPTDYVSSFENGFAAIEVSGMYGFIDHSGEFVIPPKFLLANPFQDGMARVVAEGPCFYMSHQHCSSVTSLPHGANSKESTHECKFTFVDTSGHILSEQRFDDARSFSEDVAPVSLNGLWGYVDKSGILAIPPKFDSAESFSDGLALVSKDDKFGYIDHSGTFVIPPQFPTGYEFSEKRAVVGDGDVYWYIDTSGKPAFPERFLAASQFFKGLAHVELIPNESDVKPGEDQIQTSFAYIDSSGRHIFTYKP